MTRIPAGGRLGRYQIERMLGAGAMGEVYLAEDPQIGRSVAIKTVRVEEGKAAEMEERKRRLLREARAAGKLLHPNVVALFDAGEDQGVLYLAFECIEGTDLARRLEENPPLTLREVIHYVRQAAEGLDYAHRQGIVHRDIKPSNLLLGPGGQIKVSDFGIAKLAEQTSELTMTGSVVGSPHYLSPEQIRGDDLDGRSDIFSLGVLFYEILSRQRPFQGETLTTLVYQILHRDPPSVVVQRPELGTRLENVLQKMLHKDREQRFATAGEVARALALCESELPAAVLDRPAAPPDAPPLDGTRRMSTSERAVGVVPGDAPAGAAAPPPPPPPPTPTQIQTEFMATRAGAPPAAAPVVEGAKSSSKTGLIAVALVVGVLVAVLAAGGLAARRWAAGVKKEEAKVATVEPAATTPATVLSTTTTTPPPATPSTATEPAPTEPAPSEPAPAVDPGSRFSQAPEPAPEPVRTAPERPTGPAADPAPVTPRRTEPKPEPRPAAPAPEPEPEPAVEEPEPEAEPVPPVAERPGIAPHIDRVVATGMALSFVIEPEDAIVKIDNRVIGQAWTWNAKKKDGRAYDLPDPGDHLVRILAAGKTYTIRVVASEGAPSPTIIAVNLEDGGKANKRRRANQRN